MNKIITAAVSFFVMASIINTKVKVTGTNHEKMVKNAKRTIIIRALGWMVAVMLLCVPTYLINPETLGYLYVIFVVTAVSAFALINLRFKFIDKQVKKSIKAYKAEEERRSALLRKADRTSYINKQKENMVIKSLEVKGNITEVTEVLTDKASETKSYLIESSDVLASKISTFKSNAQKIKNKAWNNITFTK